ncbi:MAG: hypothetical protein ACK4ZN_08795 [Oceanibaculum sp.]
MLIVAVALTIAGCTPSRMIGNIEDAAKEDTTLAQRMADRILGEVSGQDHRSARMCLIVAVIGEVVADRFSLEPENAVVGYGYIASLDAAVDQFEAADDMFLNTDIAKVTLTVTAILVDSAKSRLPTLLSNFAGGVNVLGLLDRAKIAARQGTLLSAGIADIRNRIEALNEGTADPALTMAGCRRRIDTIQARMGAMIGAIDVPAPPVTLESLP